MNEVWTNEIWRLFGIALAAVVAGGVLGYPLLGLVVGLLIYLGLHLYQLGLLERWLDRGGSKQSLPEVSGVLGHLAYLVFRMRKQHRERKQRLSSMLSQFNASASAIPDATLVLGSQGEIEWMNRAAGTLLGISGSDDLGQRVDNLLRNPRFRDYFYAEDYREALELVSPRDPKLVLSLRVVPYGEDKRLLTARDISEQARIRQMRKDFVANVSHELRTPLTVITGYLETLENDRDLPAEIIRRLAAVTKQTKRMNNIVEDLLTLSRLEARSLPMSECKPVLIAPLLAILVEDARKLSGEEAHELESEINPNLALNGRESELLSAFANLINNAVRHTPAGTRIEVKWFANGSAGYLEVKDNGPGIGVQHLTRLTERFYRGDPGRSRDQGGTGLGLAIVKHILQRHDAGLEIHSEISKGSCFQCHFPAERIVMVQHGKPRGQNISL